MAQGLTNVTRAVGDFMKEHPGLTQALTVGASLFGGLVAAAVPVTFAIRSMGAAARLLKFSFFGIKAGAGFVLEKFGLLPKAASTAADSLRLAGSAGRSAANGIRPVGTAMAGAGNAAAAAQGKVSGFCNVMNGVGKGFAIVGLIEASIEALKLLGKAFDAVVDKALGAGSAAKAADLNDRAHDLTGDGRGLHDLSDAEIMDLAGAASGGIVTRPTVLMTGEGGEPEAILPLSRLASMLPQQREPGKTEGPMPLTGMASVFWKAGEALWSRMIPAGSSAAEADQDAGMPLLSRLSSMLSAPQPHAQGGNISVNFSPNIQVTSQGGDAYAQVSRALTEGAASLRRDLERMMQDQRRLAYF